MSLEDFAKTHQEAVNIIAGALSDCSHPSLTLENHKGNARAIIARLAHADILIEKIKRPLQSEQPGMTDKEKEVMHYLVRFWNAFLELPDQESTETVCNAVHSIQGVLAVRVARRVNPEVWR